MHSRHIGLHRAVPGRLVCLVCGRDRLKPASMSYPERIPFHYSGVGTCDKPCVGGAPIPDEDRRGGVHTGLDCAECRKVARVEKGMA